MRKDYLDSIKKDYTAALEKEKALEREEEQAARVLKGLRTGKDKGFPSNINEQNIDPSTSGIGKLGAMTRTYISRTGD